MKVVCKFNTLTSIKCSETKSRLKKYIKLPDDDELDIRIGEKYVVYGLLFWNNCPWFYLCSENYDEYPKPYPSEFFDIIDDRISLYWKLSFYSQSNHEAKTSLVFEEWAKDPNYYERLIDGDINAVELFAKYRQIIDKE